MSIKRHKSESKFDLPTKFRNSIKNYKLILESTTKTEDIVAKVEKDVQNKIIYNTSNDIDYYDIPVQQDQWGSKRKDQGNFRSIYMLSELQMLRGTPYYDRIQQEFKQLEGKKQFSQTDKVEQEIKLSTELKGVEKQIRGKLKNKQGNVLLLSEIYDKLDENIENQTIVNQTKYLMLKRKDEEKKQEMLDNLDKFHKKIKKEREEQKKLQELHKLDKEKQEKELERQRSLYKKGIDRRQSLINIVKSNMAKSSMQQLQRKNSPDPDMYSSFQPQIPISNSGSSENILQPPKKKAERLSQFLRGGGQAFKQKRVDTNESEVEREEFLNQFNDAYSQIKQYNEDSKDDTQLGSDRQTNKQIQKYLQGGVGVDAALDDNAVEENLKFDITPEGIQLKLNAIYSNTVLTNFKSVVLKANYFEKQSNKIEVKLDSLLVNTEAFINQKENTLRIIRQENHVISQKMRDIRNYIESLLKEKFELQNYEDLQSPMGSNKDIKKNTSHHSHHVHKPKESRQTLINDLMRKEEKLKDIDDQLEMFRDNFKKFKQKMDYNHDILNNIEEQIQKRRKEYKIQTKTQKSLYKELLIKGEDIRDTGLSWIIQKLWSLEEEVTKIDLPGYLDDKAKEYLLKRAQKLLDLNENVVLLDLYLDMYKTNLQLHSQGGMLGQTIEYDEIETQPDGQSSIKMDLSGDVLPPIANNNNNSQTLGSFNKSNINNLNITTTQNNLSYVDVELMREMEMQSKKNKSLSYVDRLLDGMDNEHQDIANTTINRLNQTKHTSSDLIYEETSSKIKNNVKKWLDQERKEVRSINTGKNFEPDFNNPDQYQPLIHKVELYEDGKHINKHSNREEFIEDYRQLQKKITKQKQKLKQIDDEQIQRIIKEFDFKNYDIKYNTNCATVLGGMFGASQADKLIIRYGMSKK